MMPQRAPKLSSETRAVYLEGKSSPSYLRGWNKLPPFKPDRKFLGERQGERGREREGGEGREGRRVSQNGKTITVA